MNDPARMLISLTQALATMGLYGESHPATQRAVEMAYIRPEDGETGLPVGRASASRSPSNSMTRPTR